MPLANKQLAVVDASVAGRALFGVEDKERGACARLLPQIAIWVPDLFFVEMASVALKYVRAKFLPLGEAPKLLNGVHQQVTPVSMRLLWPNAPGLAEKLRHSIYDCAYLVLAKSMDCPLYTVDRKLARAAPRRCVFVADVRRA